MMIRIFLLIFALLPSSECTCGWGTYGSNGTANLVSETNTSYVWAVGVPKIEIDVIIQCHVRFDDRYKIFYFHDGDSLSTTSHFVELYAHYRAGCGVGKHNTEKTYVESCSIRDTTMTIRFVMKDLTMSQNASTFVIINHPRWSSIFQTQPVILKYCEVENLPNNLQLIGSNTSQQYPYGRYSVKCSSGNRLLDNSRYVNNMHVTCGRYAAWEVPQYECVQGILFNCSTSAIDIMWKQTNHNFGFLQSLQLSDLQMDTAIKDTNVKILLTETPNISIQETTTPNPSDYCVTITQLSTAKYVITVELIVGRQEGKLKSIAKVTYKSEKSSLKLTFVDLK